MTTQAYSTVTFLGATVYGFSSSMGWNDEISSITINLVEDDNDAFSPPETGTPLIFNFHGWVFSGLLDKWVKSYGFNGNPVYDVTLVDPRNILDGVSVILDDYTGIAPIPNIINAYGYLENFYGFGGSQKNESGIPYLLLGQAILTCVMSSSGNAYGGPIKYKNTAFGLDLTNLPYLPSYYRVGGTSKMSLMEIIRDICEAGGCESFFRLEWSGSLPIIKLYTISRRTIPNIGVINQFVTSTQGAVSKEVGLEMVNDVCAKMVVGGKKTTLFGQSLTGGNDGDFTTGIDNTIAPFWGHSLTGELAYGDGIGYEHTFPIDSRNIDYPGIDSIYYSDVAEIIAIFAGYDYWQNFLWMNWSNEYRINPLGSEIAVFKKIKKFKPTLAQNIFNTINNTNYSNYEIIDSNISYRHSGIKNPHFLKAPLLNIGGNINVNIASLLFGTTNTAIFNMLPTVCENTPGVFCNLSEELHQTLLKFASEYYGRKYMVRLPEVYVKKDSDTNRLSYSALPTNSAWLESGDVASAQSSNLLPLDFNWITDENNKIECYVRFDNVWNYSFANIAQHDMRFSADRNSIFIKCQLESDFVFLNKDNYTSPRAVITLPGIVSVKHDNNLSNNILRQFLFKMVGSNISQTTAENFMAQLAATSNLSGSSFNTEVNLAVTPDFAAIPLESQVDLYGPWYISTAIGKTEMEHDESLVPWNYGSSALMDLAGQAKVTEMGVNLQNLEYGTVEYPGVPDLQLGDKLLQVGPYVTDINVTIGTGGITTRYSMKSWSIRLGKIWKYTADRFFKIKKAQVDILRQIREIRGKIK